MSPALRALVTDPQVQRQLAARRPTFQPSRWSEAKGGKTSRRPWSHREREIVDSFLRKCS